MSGHTLKSSLQVLNEMNHAKSIKAKCSLMSELGAMFESSTAHPKELFSMLASTYADNLASYGVMILNSIWRDTASSPVPPTDPQQTEDVSDILMTLKDLQLQSMATLLQ